MTASYLQALRLLSRDVRLYLVTALLFGFSYAGIYFLLVNLYLLRLGYDLEFIGLFVATGALSFAVFSLPAGALCRRWGCRRTMIAGVIVVIVGLGLLSLAALLPPGLRAPWLIFFCALRELGNALYMVGSSPFLMAVTSETERNHAFSVRAALTPLAGFAGSLVGGLLPGWSAALLGLRAEDPVAFLLPLLFAALIFVPGVLALVATRPVEAAPPPRANGPAERPPYGLIAPMAVVGFLYMIASAAYLSFFNVYMDAELSVPTEWIGMLAATGQLLAAPLALTTPLLARRWGNDRAFVALALGTAVSLLPLALLPHWGAAGLGIVGVMVLNAMALPVVSVFHQELVKDTWKPTMSGAFSMAAALGWTAIAALGGFLIGAWGYAPFFMSAAGLTAAGALFFAIYFRRAKQKAGPPLGRMRMN